MVGEGVTHEEALRRFRVEDAASGILQPLIQANWPNTFAGLWINSPPEEFGVSVAFTSSAQANVDQLRQLFAFPSDLRAVDATMPQNVLLSILDQMLHDRTALQNGTPPAGLPQAIKDTNGRYDLGTDVPSNMLVVTVETPSDELLEAFRSSYTGQIFMRAGLSKPAGCASQFDCRYAMMGGLELEIPSIAPQVVGPVVCSSSFTAFYTADPSKNYVISAGHCGDDTQHQGTNYRNGGAQYGPVTRSTTAGRVDAERVRRDFAPWRESGKFLVLDETNPRRVLDYQRYADMLVGEYIGKTGRTTGTTRGYVRDLDFRPGYIPNSSNFVRASYCAAGGDSGGAVWRGNSAWGVHSGSVVWGSDGCRNINGDVQAGAQGIFGVIEFALNDLGLSLHSINLPPDAVISSISCSGLTCTFGGSGSRDPDGSIVSYFWKFGDGASANGVSVSHTYAAPGAYSASLTVRDNDDAIVVVSQTVNRNLYPPTLNSATRRVGVCGVTLSWAGPGAGLAPSSYDVYRSTTSGGPYALVANVPGSNTTVTDGTVAANTTYYYVMKSGYGSYRSANSNQKSVATGVCV